MPSSIRRAAVAALCLIAMWVQSVVAQSAAGRRPETPSALTLPHPDILGGANVTPPQAAPADTALVAPAPVTSIVPAEKIMPAPPVAGAVPQATPGQQVAQPAASELPPVATGDESLEIRRPESGGTPPRSVAGGDIPSGGGLSRAHDEAVLRPKSATSSMWRLSDLLPLAAVLVLIGILAFFVRRHMPARRLLGGAGAMDIVARLPVSSKQHLLLVKLGHRLVLLGVTGEQINTLMLVDDPEEVGVLMGEAASRRVGSSTEAFSRALLDERDEYGEPAALTAEARGQIRGLLDRVRRLGDSRGVA